jgi:mannose-6-phosphate isomerase-like protein (cupin superfamily)
MAHHRVNEVHLVLMGRDDVSIEGIQRVNGIEDGDCPIHWHGMFRRFSAIAGTKC